MHPGGDGGEAERDMFWALLVAALLAPTYGVKKQSHAEIVLGHEEQVIIGSDGNALHPLHVEHPHFRKVKTEITEKYL